MNAPFTPTTATIALARHTARRLRAAARDKSCLGYQARRLSRMLARVRRQQDWRLTTEHAGATDLAWFLRRYDALIESECRAAANRSPESMARACEAFGLVAPKWREAA